MFFTPFLWRGAGGEAMAQSGQKFATNGNSLSSGDFLGSTNNLPLIIKVNNLQKASFHNSGLDVNGNLRTTQHAFIDSTLNAWSLVASQSLRAGQLTLSGNSITSASGLVSFGSNDIITQGNIEAETINVVKLLLNGQKPNYLTLSGGELSGVIGYDADYSSYFGAYSLIDKTYLESRLNNLHSIYTPGTGTNSVVNNLSAGNNAEGENTLISSGSQNHISTNAHYGVITGGKNNKIQNAPAPPPSPTTHTYNFIGNGENNTIEESTGHSSIINGTGNIVALGGTHSIIAGGEDNTVSGNHAAILSGKKNNAFAPYSIVGSGEGNTIEPNSTHSVISGGFNNYIQNAPAGSNYNYIGGGKQNMIESGSGGSVVVGGENNIAGATDGNGWSVVVGGTSNISRGNNSSILAGSGNNIQHSHYSAIVNGQQNRIVEPTSSGNSQYNTILNGINCEIEPDIYYSTILNGDYNKIRSGANNSVILNGIGIIATEANTAYTPNLKLVGTAGVDGITFPDGTIQTTAAGGNHVFTNLNVTNRLKVGTSSLIIEQLNPQQTGPENHIFTSAGSGNLYINNAPASSNPQEDADVIISANSLQEHGKVGIGTNNPQKKLHVKTNHVPTGGGQQGSHFGIRVEDISANGNPSVWDIEPKSLGTTGSEQAALQIGQPNNPLVTLRNGNMGLGTNNPQNRLEVCGTIKSKEWIVEPDGWCDFAFKPDYQKMHWKEKKKNYTEKGYLPYMDSGKEIETNGLRSHNLKGMMLNIEENRLDITEIFERLENLENENKQLKKQIEQMQKGN
jgi:hypothetical protein